MSVLSSETQVFHKQVADANRQTFWNTGKSEDEDKVVSEHKSFLNLYS